MARRETESDGFVVPMSQNKRFLFWCCPLKIGTFKYFLNPYLLYIIYYQDYVKKLICLVERRLVKGETIPHNEKIFSIFEPHTGWIVKGKAGLICELGQKMLVTTNEDHFIVSWKLADNQEDVNLIEEEIQNTQAKYPKKKGSHSFDKGFSKKSQNQELKQQYPNIRFIIEKKGKPNQKEKQEQQEEGFKTLRKKHNVIESNIHELMCCGLDLCVDKGEANYRRYVALEVLIFNLKNWEKN